MPFTLATWPVHSGVTPENWRTQRLRRDRPRQRVVVRRGLVLRLLAVASASVVLPGLPAASGAHLTVSGCPMSHVHYTPYPGAEQGLGAVPWLSTAPGGRFKAHLFFYDPTMFPWAKQHLLGARIFTTRKQRQINPKVLWITRTKGYTQILTIHGQRLDAPGSFSDTYRGFGDYPSYVKVPAPGCWRVTVTTGRVTGRVVFSATD
jgi:hypothetical protein